MKCPLCFSEGIHFYSGQDRTFLECNLCKGIFVSEENLPDPVAERERYETHNNDVDDLAYQKFVSPIVKSVITDFDPSVHVGLDFGAGTGPVITKLLKDHDFQIFAYDPFFLPFPELLQKSYDFIVCCEVIEHFQNPAKEFRLLRAMLRPGGKLYCMTHIYPPGIDFSNWYYKNDPTHVFIYREETFDFIKDHFAFQQVGIKDRLITFSS